MIYFDNAATTRAMPEAVEKMAHMLCEEYGNPASVSSMGLAVEKEIKKAAESIARGIHCNPDEVFFTSGGTEGDNWAIYEKAGGRWRGGNLAERGQAGAYFPCGAGSSNPTGYCPGERDTCE